MYPVKCKCILIALCFLMLGDIFSVVQADASETTADTFMRVLFERYHGFLDRSAVLQDCQKTDAITQITRAVHTSSDSAFIVRLYFGSLGGLRHYEKMSYQNLDNYVSSFWRGEKNLFEIAELILESQEFKSIPGTLDISAEQFVTLAYKNFLDREPDQEGLDFWVSYLSSQGAQGRAKLLVLFSESAEASQKVQVSVNTIIAYYSLLKRLPAKQELLEKQTLSLDDLLKGLLAEQKTIVLPCTPVSPPPVGGSGDDPDAGAPVVCPDGNELAVEEPIPHGTFSRLIKKGQCYSFRFNSGDVPGFVSFSEATGGQRQTTKIVTISRRKADFSQISVSRECYREDIINTIQYRIKPINPELQGAVCALEPNTDYYINIRDIGCFAGETCSFKMVRG